jgi:hypothetical protein
MKRAALMTLLSAAGILAAPGLAPAACLKADAGGQVAEGRVLSIRFTDFAGRTEQAFILRPATPTCLEGDSDYDKVERTDRIHIYSMDARMRRKIRGLVGRTVRVKGDPFGEHTVYHHAPIVMSVSEIEPVR